MNVFFFFCEVIRQRFQTSFVILTKITKTRIFNEGKITGNFGGHFTILACRILFYASSEPHEIICCMSFAHDVWYPKMKTNHTCTKMYFHFRKFIYRWQYPQGGDCYRTVVKRKGCRIEKSVVARRVLSCYDNELACISISCLQASQYETAGILRTVYCVKIQGLQEEMLLEYFNRETF